MLAWMVSMVQLVQIHDLSTEKHHVFLSVTLQRQSCPQIGKMAYCVLHKQVSIFVLIIGGTVECSKDLKSICK